MEEQDNSAAAARASPASTTTTTSTGYVLGQRVQVVSSAEKNMQVGTVKYIGPVAGYHGMWVGVDWDSGKGRHNGTVNGVHYFDTTEAQSGTFVRPYIINAGLSIVDALNLRYRASSSDKDKEEMYVVSVRQRRVAVQLVGLEKIEERQKHLDALVSAMLMYTGVASVGPPGELRATAPNIRELDLTANLLPDWHEVGRLCDELQDLSILDLSSSRIRIGPAPLPTLSTLKTLVLNCCRLTWEQVNKLKDSIPQIEELHLAGNLIGLLEPVGTADAGEAASSHRGLVHGFESLRLLNLEDNKIDSWEEVMRLAALQSLKQLHLSGNSISKIGFSGLEATSVPTSSELIKGGVGFEKLETLLLANNRLSDWASIDALDSLPHLKDIRLTGNPVVDSNGSNSRFMLIARLGKITSLNGSLVKPRERKDSEIRYVRYIISTTSMCKEGDLAELHPRFAQLQAVHDVPIDSVHVGAAPATKKLAASLLQINIHCVAPSTGERPPVTKKLPASTTVGKLKLLCQGLFKLNVEDQCLFLTDEDTPFPLPLDDDMETLGELGLMPGSTIVINDKDTLV